MRGTGAGALLALALALAAVAPARAADPAPAALEASDVHVSSAALGPASPQARAELRAAAADLADQGRPVKLAIVAGPAGAPSMRVYARRLADALGGGATLVVTAPGRPVIAVGPVAPADITRRLREERVGAIANPVDRVVRAAQLAAPPAPEDEGSGSREALILLGLAALGGAWAVAWGARREARRQRDRVFEARAAATVRLDAAGARAAALDDRPGLTPAARAELARAVASHAQAATALREARSIGDVARADGVVSEALGALARAGDAIGADQPAGDAFAGLCGADPAHGPATATAEIDAGGDPVAVCDACHEEAEAGRPPRRRLVPIGGRPAPFTEIGGDGSEPA